MLYPNICEQNNIAPINLVSVTLWYVLSLMLFSLHLGTLSIKNFKIKQNKHITKYFIALKYHEFPTQLCNKNISNYATMNTIRAATSCQYYEILCYIYLQTFCHYHCEKFIENKGIS